MRYILIILGVLLLLIFGIVIFTRGSSNQTITNNHINLSSYVTNNNGSVQWTVDGPINALENHRAIRINVSPTTRTLQVIYGYDGSVHYNETLPNTTAAYSNFIAAIQRAQFTNQRFTSIKNYQSICPTGNRSTYEVINGGSDAQKLWSANCVAGSFGGNIGLTVTLFQAQIPNYSSITAGVDTGGSTSPSNNGLL